MKGLSPVAVVPAVTVVEESGPVVVDVVVAGDAVGPVVH